MIGGADFFRLPRSEGEISLLQRKSYCATTIGVLALSGVALYGDSFGYSSSGVQSYTAATSGVYQIIVDGASGSNSSTGTATGGYGASLDFDLNLTAGQTLQIFVGQAGTESGGGGGSFVFVNGVFLAVAGGGGGAGVDPNDGALSNGGNALLTTNGGTPGAGGAGGTGGAGGSGVPALFGGGTGGGGGGGGLNSSGGDGNGAGSGGHGFYVASNSLMGGSSGGGYGGGGAAGGDSFAGGGGGGCSGGGGGSVDGNGNVYGGGGGGSCWATVDMLSSSILTTEGDGLVEVIAPVSTAPEPNGLALLGFGGVALLTVKLRGRLFR